MKKPKYLLLFLLFPLLNFAQPIKSLFPGDTNRDGTCNHYDLLPIGMKYSQIFEPREPAGLEWMPQTFISWPDSLPVSFVNTGFADCDGNGIVDDLDMDAFPLNYDSTQSESIPPPENWLSKLTDTLFSSAVPILRLTFDKAIAFEGDTLLGILTYSIPPAHPTQALGVAVWFTYPTQFVVESKLKVEADTSGNELMYVAAISNAVNIWRSPPPGNIQFAAAARGQNDLAGDDTLAFFTIIIEDKFIALNEPFTLECKEALLLNSDEQVIPFIFEKDSVILERRVAVKEPARGLAEQTIVFPNPANGYFTINCPETIHSILLMDMDGQKLFFENKLRRKSVQSSFPSGLPSGTYLLEISTQTGSFVKEIQKL